MNKLIGFAITIFLIYQIMCASQDDLSNPDIQKAIEIGNDPNRPVNATCGISNPVVSTDCTKFNQVTLKCCLLTPISAGAKMCKPISPVDLSSNQTTFSVNGTNYDLACDIIPGSLGNPCGNPLPKNASDCAVYNTKNNTCCYYDNKVDTQYCFWAGSAMEGSLIAAMQCVRNSGTFFMLPKLMILVLTLVLFL